MLVVAQKAGRIEARSGNLELDGANSVLKIPSWPTWKNDPKSSGGETRTLNLAVNSRLLCH